MIPLRLHEAAVRRVEAAVAHDSRSAQEDRKHRATKRRDRDRDRDRGRGNRCATGIARVRRTLISISHSRKIEFWLSQNKSRCRC
jgi:hypothetical protein